jgi:hypothetical protein
MNQRKPRRGRRPRRGNVGQVMAEALDKDARAQRARNLLAIRAVHGASVEYVRWGLDGDPKEDWALAEAALLANPTEALALAWEARHAARRVA